MIFRTNLAVTTRKGRGPSPAHQAVPRCEPRGDRQMVAEIKIDRSFAARLAHDPEDAAIVGSTIDPAHSLGLRVVAEGAEDDETWDRLATLDCDVAQGWLVARAMPAEEATQWLDRFGCEGPYKGRKLAG